MTLNTVYISNRYFDRDISYRIGTTEIRLGNDPGSYNNVNSVVWPALYDGGFFPIETTYNGRYLTFRRLSQSAGYYLNEIRAYQVPNLLQVLSSIAITSDTSPSYSTDTTAANLITNLSNRASNDEYPINTVDSGLADYYSCFKVTEAEISSLGHILIFGIDLGYIYFQHAILII